MIWYDFQGSSRVILSTTCIYQNVLQLDIITVLVNISWEFGVIMHDWYYFLGPTDSLSYLKKRSKQLKLDIIHFSCKLGYNDHIWFLWNYSSDMAVTPVGHYVFGLSVFPSVCHALGVPLCVQRPAKAMPFQQIIMHALQCQHDLDVHLLFCVDLDLHITSFRDRV